MVVGKNQNSSGKNFIGILAPWIWPNTGKHTAFYNSHIACLDPLGSPSRLTLNSHASGAACSPLLRNGMRMSPDTDEWASSMTISVCSLCLFSPAMSFIDTIPSAWRTTRRPKGESHKFRTFKDSVWQLSRRHYHVSHLVKPTIAPIVSAWPPNVLCFIRIFRRNNG